jgi:hypothetical protein
MVRVRHRVLGELGRILLQELDDARCHVSCEVVGDPSDPMTTQLCRCPAASVQRRDFGQLLCLGGHREEGFSVFIS